MSPEKSAYTTESAIEAVQQHPDFTNKNVVGYIALVHEVFINLVARIQRNKTNPIITRRRGILYLIYHQPEEIIRLIQAVDSVLSAKDGDLRQFTVIEKELIEAKFHLQTPGNTDNLTQQELIDHIAEFKPETNISTYHIAKKRSLETYIEQVYGKLYSKLDKQLFPQRFKKYRQEQKTVTNPILYLK